jgi:hypothetical protein
MSDNKAKWEANLASLEEPFKTMWEDICSELNESLPIYRGILISQLVQMEGTPIKHHIDYVCPTLALSIEIHGGTWGQGNHSRAAGMRRDMHKQRLMVLAGYKHIEVDAVMSQDRELWKDTILTLLNKVPVLTNPTKFDSWSDNLQRRKKTIRETTKIEAFLNTPGTPTTLGTTAALSNQLQVRRTTLNDVMRANGWGLYTERTTVIANYENKQVKKPRTKRIWRKLADG